MGDKDVQVLQLLAAFISFYQVPNDRETCSDGEGARIDDYVGDAVECLLRQNADDGPPANDGAVSPRGKRFNPTSHSLRPVALIAGTHGRHLEVKIQSKTLQRGTVRLNR